MSEHSQIRLGSCCVNVGTDDCTCERPTNWGTEAPKVGVCSRGTCRQPAVALTFLGWPVCGEHGGQLNERLAECIKDVCWRAQPYGETEDGDTFAYLVTKGAMHRLIGAAQGAGINAAFRVIPPDQTPPGTRVTCPDGATCQTCLHCSESGCTRGTQPGSTTDPTPPSATGAGVREGA